MISMYENTDQKNWDEILPFITQAYNTTIQETTGYSPFFLLYRREPMSLLDNENILIDSIMDDYDEYIENYLDKIARTRQVVINNTEKTQERMKRNYDKKHNEKMYDIHLVAVWKPVRKIGKCGKLLRKYFGPYRILKKLSNVNYLIEPKDNPGQDLLIVHVSRLKPYFERIDECSDRWLWRFQRKNTIASLVVSGEINKVSDETVTDWLTKFEEIKNEYKDEDIFNIVETGVFYNLLPDRSLDFKDTKCHGTSKSKEGLTVVLCCNATGSEISKLWIIGKYKNPRCLNKINRLILPFDYTHKKSAWVDAYSFRLWLIKFQRKMAAENRHVLLTMDNCSAHDTKDLDLPNVRIVYFPANCTSRIQPLDQGIIAAFNCHFLSRLVKNALLGIESEQTTVKWNILQAMRAMAASWDSVSSQTIKNCFKKLGQLLKAKQLIRFHFQKQCLMSLKNGPNSFQLQTQLKL
ncbi:TIGD4 [Cordylochernes scorpioides]|uniref:TIGD4 n=1 Tax=Cordylochernes scorpioides TaxID=51811 RepID=A0ABY6LTC8_9ARAC|nr:TIGD4 [Cordylochernes scorpioides]